MACVFPPPLGRVPPGTAVQVPRVMSVPSPESETSPKSAGGSTPAYTGAGSVAPWPATGSWGAAGWPEPGAAPSPLRQTDCGSPPTRPSACDSRGVSPRETESPSHSPTDGSDTASGARHGLHPSRRQGLRRDNHNGQRSDNCRQTCAWGSLPHAAPGLQGGSTPSAGCHHGARPA